MYSHKKIIDSHVHLSSIVYGEGYFKDIMNPNTNPLETKCVKDIIRLMDLHGIDQAIGIVSQGISKLPEENHMVIKAAEMLPERFPAVMIGFSQPESEPWNYDPQKAAAEIDEYLKNPIVKGLGEFALESISYMGEWSDMWPKLRPIFDVMAKHNAPVMFHTGISPFFQMAPKGVRLPSRRSSYMADPIFIDDIAAEYPDVPLIIGHCGVQSAFNFGRYADAALMVASRNPNVYLETSSAPYEVIKRAAYNPSIGAEKLIFGSDTPAFYYYYQDPEDGEYYPTYGKTGPTDTVPDHLNYDLENIKRLKITDLEKALILGGNIERILAQKIE